MPRAVIDTNVFVSGIIGSSYPTQITQAWRKGKFILVISIPIIEEISEVLRRPEIKKFIRLTPGKIKAIIKALKTRAYIAPTEIKVDVIEADPADNKFLACALEGFADYIITGDKKHLLPLKNFYGIKIISPKEFVTKVLSIH